MVNIWVPICSTHSQTCNLSVCCTPGSGGYGGYGGYDQSSGGGYGGTAYGAPPSAPPPSSGYSAPPPQTGYGAPPPSYGGSDASSGGYGGSSGGPPPPTSYGGGGAPYGGAPSQDGGYNSELMDSPMQGIFFCSSLRPHCYLLTWLFDTWTTAWRAWSILFRYLDLVKDGL